MASVLKTWRRDRREDGYWRKAQQRSSSLREGDLVNEIDVALMMCGQALTRYRSGLERESQLDQLREVRLQMEACLGMLDNVLQDQ